MKKVMTIFGALIAALLGLLVVRAWTFVPADRQPVPALELPPEIVSTRLAKSLTFPTISGEGYVVEPFRRMQAWMAETYPRARITAVSNSHGQRKHIEGEARARGLTNLTVVTQDMNRFDTDQRFDRIVSVEMFEHMANWRALLTKAKSWLKPDGRMFIHVFTHRDAPYRFDHTDSGDFIAQHFFTGGIMPSRGLIRQFPDLFAVEQEWTWNGGHYARTANHWLANMDRNAGRVAVLMRETYGADAKLWTRRWRRFYLATAGLFGNDGGRTWAVSHYRLKPA